MPSNRLSFRVTDAYRDALAETVETVAAATRILWARMPREQPDLEGEHARLLEALLPRVLAAQIRAIELASGYLSSFLSSETGERTTVETSNDRVGFARDGRPLPEAMRSPLAATLGALKGGQSLDVALRAGERRGVLIAGLAVDEAAQHALLVGIDTNDRFAGWQRAVRGTCGACLGSATGASRGLRFAKHPGCKCVSEPIVAGVRDRYPRPTGAALFAAMTDAQQDQAVGPTVADALRAGDVTLAELVGTSPQQLGDDFLTQSPRAT